MSIDGVREMKMDTHLLETESSSTTDDEIANNTAPGTETHGSDSIRVSAKLVDVSTDPVGSGAGIPKSSVGLDICTFVFRSKPAEGAETIIGRDVNELLARLFVKRGDVSGRLFQATRVMSVFICLDWSEGK